MSATNKRLDPGFLADAYASKAKSAALFEEHVLSDNPSDLFKIGEKLGSCQDGGVFKVLFECLYLSASAVLLSD